MDIDAIAMSPEIRLECILYFYSKLSLVTWLVRNTPWTLWFLDELWARERVFEDERRALHHLYASTRGRNAGARGMRVQLAAVVLRNGRFHHSSRGTTRDGQVCRVRALLRARAGALMRAKGMFVAADVDVPPPSAWTCLTKNA